MRWLITRPKADGDRVASALEAIGHGALVCPLISVTFTNWSPVDLSTVHAVVATSRHGVVGLARLTERRDMTVYAVGDATAQIARIEGFRFVESANGDDNKLVALVARRVDPSAGTVLRVRGEVARVDVAQRLTDFGFDVQSLVTYRIDTVSHLPDAIIPALIQPMIDGVLFFSPRSAKLFARLVGEAALGDCLSGLTALCHSPAIAKCLERDRWRIVHAAGSPNLAALIALARECESPSTEIRPSAIEEPK